MGDVLGLLVFGGMAVVVAAAIFIFRPRRHQVPRRGGGPSAHDPWSGAPGRSWSSGSSDCGSDSGGGGDSSC